MNRIEGGQWWAVLHRYGSRCLDGPGSHIGYEPNKPGWPQLFKTRRECQAFIDQHYAYFKRPDLRAYPHGWLMPRPARVKVVLA